MKFLALLAVMALSTSAFAYEAGSFDFKCSSLENVGGYPLEVQLTQLTRASFDEEEEVPFQLKITEVRPVWQEFLVVPLVYNVTLLTGDVHFDFNSADGKVYFGGYLDEMDEVVLSFPGSKTSVDFVCKWPKDK